MRKFVCGLACLAAVMGEQVKIAGNLYEKVLIQDANGESYVRFTKVVPSETANQNE